MPETLRESRKNLNDSEQILLPHAKSRTNHLSPRFFSSLLDPSRQWLSDDQRLGRKETNKIIIDVDYHLSDPYIAFVDTETGEGDERRLNHSDKEAEKFYRGLAA